MIELIGDGARVRIDPTFGARVTDLEIDGVEIIVPGDRDSDDPLEWGLYPMVPFAGRLRDGRLDWRGSVYQLPRRRAPHAIHGTVFDVAWDTVRSTDEPDRATSCTMTTPLVDPWPFTGTVEHRIDLGADRLDLRLTVHADVDMPVHLGWHPWFVKPERTNFPFGAVHGRDESGIAEPIARTVESVSWGDVDDCFTDLDGILTITIGGRELRLESSCRHWVVFDRPTHATCVEPQSGPPNVLSHDPVVVRAGDSVSETFTIRWCP